VTGSGRRASGEGGIGRLRRSVTLAAAALIFATLAGATYQGVSTAFERREYPPPGVMVDVGGHQLHVYCSGSGAPTVVLEAAAMGTAGAWAWVTPLVAPQRRVCVYDRAGLGWSESGDQGFDPLRVADELHVLLENANEHGPFVLVGHGLGASFARLYATRFPADLQGLVLVDPPVPGTGRDQQVARLVTMAPWLARVGILRATRLLSTEARTLPGRMGGATRAFLNRPDHLTRAGHELERWDEIVALAARLPVPPVPVRSIAVAGPDPLALITSEAQAQQVATAIEEVIRAGT
jgi:pimeloyl-ACP methyl ester carboxylesterase